MADSQRPVVREGRRETFRVETMLGDSTDGGGCSRSILRPTLSGRIVLLPVARKLGRFPSVFVCFFVFLEIEKKLFEKIRVHSYGYRHICIRLQFVHDNGVINDVTRIKLSSVPMLNLVMVSCQVLIVIRICRRKKKSF